MVCLKSLNSFTTFNKFWHFNQNLSMWSHRWLSLGYMSDFFFTQKFPVLESDPQTIFYFTSTDKFTLNFTQLLTSERKISVPMFKFHFFYLIVQSYNKLLSTRMSQYLDRGRDKYCRIFQGKHHAVRHIHLWQVQTQMTKNY